MALAAALPEGRVLIRRQFGVVPQLIERHPQAKCGYTVRVNHAAFGDRLLTRPGIGFVLDAVPGPKDNAVENHRILGVALATAEPWLDRELVVR